MKRYAFTTIALLGLATTAWAGHGEKHGKGFDKYDTNGDGVVSMDEVGEEKAKKWAKLDFDGDGVVTKAEYKEYKAMKKKKRDEA